MQQLLEFIANHLFLCSLLVALILLLLWNILGDTLSGVKSVSPAEATALMNREDAFVIDVRPGSDFAAGHILNAESFPANEIKQQENRLKKYKGRPLVVYCQHGQESARISGLLKQMGFSQAYPLRGGLTAWTNANFPILRGNS